MVELLSCALRAEHLDAVDLALLATPVRSARQPRALPSASTPQFAQTSTIRTPLGIAVSLHERERRLRLLQPERVV
jgi:hypothetical protein